MTPSSQLNRILALLKKDGLLLEADNQLPSVATIIAGESISGSWWGHKKGKEIFNTSGAIHDHPDVLAVKLVSGKVTFVHKAYWRPLIAIASSREGWQTDGLSAGAKSLLEKIKAKPIRTDQIRSALSAKDLSKAVRELEARLLVRTESVHTESGKHAKQLETWPVWARRNRFRSAKMDIDEAKKVLEDLLADLNRRYGADAWLPW